MNNWSDLFDSYGLDKNALQLFQPKGEITLIESESELNEVEEWLQYQALGVAVVPIFSNGEGDYIGVFTDDILKGKSDVLRS